jgi:hypothetical protein
MNSELVPILSAQRGRKWLATHPTIGAPIGVPPSAMATRKAITLPRIAGSAEGCMTYGRFANSPSALRVRVSVAIQAGSNAEQTPANSLVKDETPKPCRSL